MTDPLSLAIAIIKGCVPQPLLDRPGYPADHCYCEGVGEGGGHAPPPDTFGLLDWLTPEASHALWVDLGRVPDGRAVLGTNGEGQYLSFSIGGETIFQRYIYYLSVEQAIAEAWLTWKQRPNL